MIDRSTLEALLAERGWVQRLARSLAHDVASADDVTQESWLRALRRPPEHAGNLRSWFGFLVRRTAKDRARGEARRSAREELGARASESEGSPAESLERIELVRELAEALTCLAEPFRTVVVMRYLEEREPKDIARSLGVNAATVRSRLSRGLGMLRGDLERRHGKGREGLLSALALFAPRGGLVLMGLKTKTACAVALLALLAFLGWRLLPTREGESVAREPLAALARVEAPSAVSDPTMPPVRARGEVEPSPARTAGGSLRIEVFSKGSSSPAVGVGVRTQFTRSGTWEQEWEDQSDSDGCVLKADMPAGVYAVSCDRNAEAQRVEISEGAMTTVRLSVQQGIVVDGLVVDLDGRPVAGAGIVLSWGYQHDGHIALRADAQGRFQVEDLANGQYVGARMAGHAPSLDHRIEGRAGDRIEVRLVLPAGGGALSGLVLSAEGTPVAGARIEARDPAGEGGITLPDGQWGANAGSIGVVSASDGSYRIDGLTPGTTAVHTLAKDHVSWLGTVTITSDTETALDIRLGRGASIVGTILDAEGAPAVGTKVQISCHPEVRAMLVDADGHFSQSGLASGVYSMSVDGRGRGHVQGSVELRDGESTTWDCKLDPGNVYSGRLVDESGVPLAGWLAKVQQTNEEFYYRIQDGKFVIQYPDWWGWTTTDQDGRFQASSLPTGMPFRIEVRLPRQFGTKPVAVLEDQKANGPEVTIVVKAADLELGVVSGVLVNERGAPLDDAKAWLAEVPVMSGAPVGPDSRLEKGTGRFSIRNVPRGQWQLRVDAAGYSCDLPSFSVENAATLDLGTIQLHRLSAALTVRLKRAGGGPLGRPPVVLKDLDYNWVASLPLEGDRASSTALSAGTFLLRVEEAGKATAEQRVTLRDGVEVKLEIELPALPK